MVWHQISLIPCFTRVQMCELSMAVSCGASLVSSLILSSLSSHLNALHAYCNCCPSYRTWITSRNLPVPVTGRLATRAWLSSSLGLGFFWKYLCQFFRPPPIGNP